MFIIGGQTALRGTEGQAETLAVLPLLRGIESSTKSV